MRLRTRARVRSPNAKSPPGSKVGPVPIATDLIRSVPQEKIDRLVSRQAIPRLGTPADIANVIDFYLRPESDFITGQCLFLGGV